MNKLKNLLLPFLVVCALIFSFKVAIVPVSYTHLYSGGCYPIRDSNNLYIGVELKLD